eukprot:COSAG04_NODE_9108_length_897_cov_1.082707_2_plen_44_part_01
MNLDNTRFRRLGEQQCGGFDVRRRWQAAGAVVPFVARAFSRSKQ